MIEVRYIYEHNGNPVNEYTIRSNKYQVSVINIGAAITKIVVVNKYDKYENICLRYYDYKFYKDNQYQLGALIDYKKFQNNEPSTLTLYFNCLIEKNSLVFTYNENNSYIKVKYTLLDNCLLIEYDNNMDLVLSNIIYFNLSGNVKRNISDSLLILEDTIINLNDNTKHITNLNDINLNLLNKETKILCNLQTKFTNLFVCLGNHFNKQFLVNKGILATNNLGIGFIVGGNYQQAIKYHFSTI